MRKYNPYLLQLLAREFDEERFVRYVGLVVQKLEVGRRYGRAEIASIVRDILLEMGMNPNSFRSVMCKFYNDLRRLYIIKAGSPLEPWDSDSVVAEVVDPVVRYAKMFRDPVKCGAIAILSAMYIYLNNRIGDANPCLENLVRLLSGESVDSIVKDLAKRYQEMCLSFNEDRVRSCVERMARLVKFVKDVVRGIEARVMVPIELWGIVYG